MRREAFWSTTRELLRFRRPLVLAVIGALISAACRGAGFSMLLPILHLFFNREAPPGATDWHPMKQFIDESIIANHSNGLRYELGQQLLAITPDSVFLSFVVILAVIAVLTVIGSTGRYFHQYLTITIAQRQAQVWRDRVFRRMVYAPVTYFLDKDTSDYSSRILVDTGVLARGHLAILGKAVAEILNGAALLIVALLIDWRLTAIALVAAPVIGVLLSRFGRVIRRASKRALREQGNLFKRLAQVTSGLLVVKTQDAEGYERRRFSQLNKAVFQQQMTMRKARALASPLIESLGLFGVMVAAGVAAWYVFEQNVAPKEFFAVLAALGAAGASIKPLTALHVEIKEADAAANRLLEASHMTMEPITHEERQQLPSLPLHRKRIVFDNVIYHYPGSEARALDDVTLEVAFGQAVAVVGPNGAGKSTLLNLLPRLIEPGDGKVIIDETDIAGVNLRSLRRQIAVVPQKSVLFEGTIAENIAYGCAYFARSKIEAAAREAYCHEFIAAHPAGYQRRLSEGGEGLSGGQKQRLCIARAILRAPTILILDEATSQIDAESEDKINQALADFRRGRTTFIIAHRLSTVVDADMIVVMNDGRIADVGQHSELLERCAIYQMLTRTQLQPAT